MCNIGVDWDKKTKIVGVAWVLRNHRGVVLLHSRSSFAQVPNREDAKLRSILWAMESMISLRLNKIVFAGQFKEEFGATLSPSEWPSFAFQSDEIRRALQAMNDAQLLVVSPKSNRGASFIAQSVTREERHHSYVAAGPP